MPEPTTLAQMLGNAASELGTGTSPTPPTPEVPVTTPTPEVPTAPAEEKKPDPKPEAKAEPKEPKKLPIPDSVFKKGAEKAGEKPPEDDVKVPDSIKGETARENFKKLELSKRELEKKIAGYEAELAQVKGEASKASKLPELEQQIATYRQKLSEVALERDPEFQSRFANRQNILLKQAETVITNSGTGTDAKAVVGLLGQAPSPWRDSQLKAAIENLDAADQRRIEAIWVQADAISAEKQEEIAKAGQLIPQIAERRKAEMAARQDEARKKAEGAFDSVVKNLSSDEGLFLLIKAEGNDEWNTAIDKEIAEARDLFIGTGAKDESTLAEAAIAYASMPRLLNYFNLQRELISEQEKTIKAMKGASPAIDGGAPPDKPDDAGMTYSQKIGAALKAQGMTS